jgi:hypothetical protein
MSQQIDAEREQAARIVAANLREKTGRQVAFKGTVALADREWQEASGDCTSHDIGLRWLPVPA